MAFPDGYRGNKHKNGSGLETMPKLVFDSIKLGIMVRQQRAGRSYREIAMELGTVSASTMHRLEQDTNHYPDMHVFTRICEWLNVSPNTFFIESDRASQLSNNLHAQIQEMVRSDAFLEPTAANILSTLITAAYQISLPTSTHP